MLLWGGIVADFYSYLGTLLSLAAQCFSDLLVASSGGRQGAPRGKSRESRRYAVV